MNHLLHFGMRRCAPALACWVAWTLGLLSALSAQGISRMELLDDTRTLRVGDRLTYQVIEEREPTMRLFVDAQGNVDVPLAGRMQAAGKTPKGFAQDVKQALEKDFYYQATVLIDFERADGARGEVKVVGMVVRPGPMPIPADEVLTASMALLRSGGTRVGADLTKVTILRGDATDPESQEKIVIDLTEVLDKGNLGADRVLQPDDTLVIPESNRLGGTYYITGEITSEGVYNLPTDNTRVTVSEAVLKAGGFAKFANKRRVVLIRADTSLPEDKRRVVVDVQRILEEGDRKNDPVLEPDDIIRVTDRKFAW
ncbi:MAG: polysaccharide biosynthesis/export family protein [Verrucomicrobiota bacterium JB022]|nr:polysaccharide biosynthesis/export family protein [Verrucomicrobiota bacterium JB022]